MTVAVSICIPTYNGEKYIKQTIDSLLTQTFQSFEIVVSDHGSADKTLQVIDGFKDSRIRVLHTDRRKSVIENWNNSVAAARGEFIKVVGQDDVLYPEGLEIEFQCLKSQDEAVGFCYSHRDIISARGRVIARPRRLGAMTSIVSIELLRSVVRYGSNPIGEPIAVLFRRSAWEHIGHFHSAAYVVDLDFYLRLLGHFEAASTRQCVGAFRIHPHSWGSSMIKEQFSIFRLLKKVWQDSEPSISMSDYIVGVTRGFVRIPLRLVAQQVLSRS